MKVSLRKTPHKTSFEIDPVNDSSNNRFAPMITVTVYHLAGKGDSEPKLVSAYAGNMTAMEAGIYSEALMLASFVCEQARKGGDLLELYKSMSVKSTEGVRRLYVEHGKSYAIH